MGWYNGSWTKRTAVVLDNTTGPTWASGAVLIRLRADFPGWASVKSDLSDLRVTDSDQTTLLNWYVDPSYSVAGSTADLYVKVAVTADSTKTIYIYYSNAGASDASSYSNTMAALPLATSNTLARYLLDDGSGTAPVDSSGNGNTAAFVGAPTWQAADGGGFKTNAVLFSSGDHIVFNGSSQYMTCGSVLNTVPSNGTIAFWFKWVSVPGGNARILTKWNDSHTTYDGLDMYYNGATHVLSTWIYHSTTPELAITAGAVLNDTNWHRIVVTWGRLGIKVWIDASIAASLPSYTGKWANSTAQVKPLTFGAYNDFDGVIQYSNAHYDAIVIEQIQWTQSQILSDFSRLPSFIRPLEILNPNATLARSGSNPVISPSTEFSSTATAVFEPTPVISTDLSSVVIMYSAGVEPSSFAIFRAHTSTGSFPTGWTKDGIKMGTGTGGESSLTCRPSVYVESGTWYLLYVNSIAGGDLRYSTSTDDGVTWAAPTTLIGTGSAPSGGDGFANSRIVKFQGTYYLFVEVHFTSGSPWRATVWTSSTITGTYTYQTTLSTLVRNTDAGVSVGTPVRVNGRWEMIYHATPTASTGLPSYLYRTILDGALTADSWTFTDDNPILLPLGTSPPEFDQTADAKPIKVGGNAYVVYDGDDNVGTYEAWINVLSVAGSVEQMFGGFPLPIPSGVETANTDPTFASSTMTIPLPVLRRTQVIII